MNLVYSSEAQRITTRLLLTTLWGRQQILVALVCANAVVASTALGTQENATDPHLLSVEQGWRFKAEDVSAARQPAYDDQTWPVTRIPHNGQGLTDDALESSAAHPLWLRNTVNLPALTPGDRVLLQVTRTRGVECWLNGEDAGSTEPDEWTFLKDVTSLVRPGLNVLALRTMLPGIQGYVRLHVLPPLHLDPRGLRIDIPDWAGGPASVRMRTQVENHSGSPRAVKLRAVVFDPAGRQLVAMDSASLVVPAGTVLPVTLRSEPIPHPPLWSPETPQLCNTTVELVEDKQSVQHQTVAFGFRWHRFEPEGPFTLNGKQYPIRGVVYVEPAEKRFPDRESLWKYEIDLLKEMGVNFVRTSRSIDQSFFEACDRAGLMVTAPIHYLAPEQTRAGEVENLVHEAYNHPSLIAWNTNGEGKNAASAKALSRTTQQLRASDPTRSVLCCELGWRSPGTVGLVDTDVAGQGNYTGWYEGTLEHIGPYMDDYRDLLRERYGHAMPILVSNFGAAGVATLHTDSPRRNDYSHEYHTAFNERFYTEIETRPWISGGFIFCWRDLNSAQPIPRHTWKGMLDLNDRKKDAYFFYQSRWTEKPMVHIAQKSWTSREAWPSEGEFPVHVFSNCEQVEMFHNGKSLGLRKEKDNRFEWSVTFRTGQNVLRAVARRGTMRIEDSYEVAIQFRPPAVEARLFSRVLVPGRSERVLTWNELPGVDEYTVYSGSEADFKDPQGVHVATTRNNSITLAPDLEQPFYKVIASSKGIAGPASAAVGLQPGSLRWKFTNEGWLLSSPAIVDLNGSGPPEIVIGSYSGMVYALRADGTELWSVDLVDPVLASPAVAALRPGDPPSVVINTTKALYVLSSQGDVIWQRDGLRQFDRSVRSPTVADLDGDGTLEIIIGTDTGQLQAFEADGRLRWDYSTAGHQNRGLNLTTPLVIDRPDSNGKAICFSTDGGILYFLNANGQELWTHDLKTGDSSVGLPPNHLTPAAGPLYDSNRLTIVSGGATLEAIATSGEVLWQRRDLSGFPQISDLFRDGNRQVVVSDRRTLHVLDRNGQDLWNFTLSHPRDYFLQPPASADLDEDGEPDLVMGTRATNLLAISSRGKLLWSFKCEDELSGTPSVADIDQDGIVDVVFGCRDGSLYVVSGGKAPPNALESRTYRWDNSRVGTYAMRSVPVSRRLESAGIGRHFLDVPYGVDYLQKMDVYLPAVSRPTGVLIEFHGGGWRRGHKGQLESYRGLIEKVMESGIAVVSANYRLTPRSIWPSQVEDAARVIQFVRSKAKEWNLDPERIALIGGSAGAHLSLWVGLHDDLADPLSDDPVRRQSTRVRGIVDCWSPTDLTHTQLVGRAREAIPQLFGTTPEEWGTPRIATLLREASPISFVSADDPPVLIVHTEPLKELPDGPDWETPDVHSILFGQLLEQSIKSVGGRAELVSQPIGTAPSTWVERAAAFVGEVLK